MTDRTETNLSKRQQQIGAVYIPSSIMCQKNLTLTQKVIWGRIEGLATKEGYCYASNKWIGSQIGFSKQTIANNISELVRKGYFRHELTHKDNGEIQERRLYPIATPLLLFTEGGITANGKGGIPGNGKESIRGLSVTEENKHTMSYSEDFEKFWAFWLSMGRGQNKLGAWDNWQTCLKGRNGKKPHVPATVAQLLTAGENYRDKCIAAGTQPEYVMLAKTFLGPDQHWRDYLEVKVHQSAVDSFADSVIAEAKA